LVNGIVFGSIGCDVKDIPSTTGRIPLQQIEETPMHYTDDSLLPENQDSLIITAAVAANFWSCGRCRRAI